MFIHKIYILHLKIYKLLFSFFFYSKILIFSIIFIISIVTICIVHKYRRGIELNRKDKDRLKIIKSAPSLEYCKWIKYKVRRVNNKRKIGIIQELIIIAIYRV